MYKRGKIEYRASDGVLYYNIIYDTIVDVLVLTRTLEASAGGSD